MLSRFFTSSECSKWPRNANAHVPVERVQTGVAEWEEPRHSGRLGVATVPPLLPLCNTIPHLSVRRLRNGSWCRRIFGSAERKTGDDSRWENNPRNARICVQIARLNAILRADRHFGGSVATDRNRAAVARLGEA